MKSGGKKEPEPKKSHMGGLRRDDERAELKIKQDGRGIRETKGRKDGIKPASIYTPTPGWPPHNDEKITPGTRAVFFFFLINTSAMLEVGSERAIGVVLLVWSGQRHRLDLLVSVCLY